jgi:ketosteroid isomerase-like protein
MYWPIKFSPIPIVLISVIFLSEINASETPETILIRQALRMDLSGKRRSDSDLTLSVYSKNFVSYDAENRNNPISWNIIIEGRQALQNSLENEIQTHRYDLQRTIPSVKVRGLLATATSLDSGNVVNRKTGEVQPVYETQFWTFVKNDDKWSITSAVRNMGNGSTESTKNSIDEDIKTLLTQISRDRESGDTSIGENFFSKDFIGYDANNNLNPTSWNIIFSGAEEFSNYLTQRSPHVDYTINCKLTSAFIGPSGSEAIAMTRETIVASHKKGVSKHSIDRNVFWTISKQQEDEWKITGMAYNFGPVVD